MAIFSLSVSIPEQPTSDPVAFIDLTDHNPMQETEGIEAKSEDFDDNGRVFLGNHLQFRLH